VIASARSLRLALAIGCALMFAGCGMGGGTTPAPANKSLASTKVVKGTGTLTIKFPKHLVHLTSANLRHGAGASRRVASQIVGGVRSTAAKRSPKFVDPNGTFLEISSFGSCDYSSLGIFNWPTGVTFVPIAPNNLDGSETVTVPIVSDSDGCPTNVYVYEVGDGDQDTSPAEYPSSAPTYSDVISYGEGVTSGGVTVGTTNPTPLTITLQIAPAMLAITEDEVTGDEGQGEFLGSSSDGATEWEIDPINYSSSDDEYAYAFVLAADYLQSSDNCYFYPPGAAGSGGMPSISIAFQQSDNDGTSRVGTVQSGAVVYYADYSEDPDGVVAEFSSTVAPFPQDGPYTPSYDWLSPVLSGETTTGWAYFYADGGG
jgi:hypothetical protein